MKWRIGDVTITKLVELEMTGGSRFLLVISIKTLYGGHSQQAAMVAAHCHAGAYCNRWTIVVDDDIDPTNFNDVIWAMCTRCDPRDQVQILHGGWSSALAFDVAILFGFAALLLTGGVAVLQRRFATA